jgi:glycosyltransferase involved in cell wall biosynthesis
MKILLVRNSRLPVQSYDDAERVVWWLGKALIQLGHSITFLAKKGSECSFAPVLTLDEKKPLEKQIPADIDLVHFHDEPEAEISKPFLITCHDHYTEPHVFHQNTVFVSHDQAHRHGGSVFVRNGIDFSEYGTPLIDARRMYFHFLGNAAWSGKNVRGAIDLATQSGARLHVMGGTRVNFRKGLRITLSPNVRFHGTLQPEGRNALLNSSKGLILPVIWHEPSGLAVPESLFFGCPVFGTPYGALPELLGKSTKGRPHKAGWNGSIEAYYSEFGCLSVKKSELLEAIRNADGYDRQKCHDYAHAHFSAIQMAKGYAHLYESVLNGHALHAEKPTLVCPPDDKPLPFGA